MFLANKYHIHPRSFHHMIKEGAGGYLDNNHFIGLDLMGSTKFRKVYEPPANIREEFHAYTLEVMVPGFTREQIQVMVENDKIIVTGKRENAGSESRCYIHHEMIVDEMRREFFLSQNTDPDQITAHMKDGVLVLTLFKKCSNKLTGRKTIPVD